MASNYDDVLDQMQAYGLEFGARDLPLEVGRMRRVRVEGDRERRGWYILHELRLDDGDLVLVGSFGIWRGADNGAQKIDLKKRALTAEQKSAMKARLAEDRKRAQAARKAEAAKAAYRAESAWRKCSATTDLAPDYLTRKGIHGYGVRFTASGAIAVPMHDAAGKIHGLQFILSRNTHGERIKRTGRDKEYWPAGLTKQGHFFLLGGTPTGLALVAEGYATAASLHQATGLPVAVAFDAGNLQPVAQALRKRYRGIKLLICADDDAFGKCPHCKKLTEQPAPTCAHCGGDTSKLSNAGTSYASAAALAVEGAWVTPVFADTATRQADAYERNRKITDFNDLHAIEGIPPVRAQIEAKLLELGWTVHPAPRGPEPKGGGDAPMPSQLSVDDAVARYWGTYGLGGKVLFDEIERRLVHRDDVMNLLPGRAWDLVKSHPRWRVARDYEIGFDPTEQDKSIRCNLFGGWPTVPKQGNCTALLELLEYLCEGETNGREVYQWILKWLAYPLQHRGAKMHSAIVVHGPQGTGKSRFFEAYAKIYGPYGRVLGQEALEDKFNADWAEKKLFILADEVLARQDMYHIKNRLKGFITGDTIRVNPKNVAAHNEKNQMNIVFLSNERQPLVLENDDRRHLVIWVPPKLPEEFFTAVNDEIDNGGVEALHHYLLTLDLGDFKPWTKPPMTRAKEDLVELGRSSEERFVNDWLAMAIDGANGDPLPVCPCQGSSLYRAYGKWCEANGERKRGAQHLISYLRKLTGWSAGNSEKTREHLKQGAPFKSRKMVIPSTTAMHEALSKSAGYVAQQRAMPRDGVSKADWLTECHFIFEHALGVSE